MQLLVDVLALKVVLKHLLDLGNASRSSYQHNFVDLALLKIGVLERIFHGRNAPVEKSLTEVLEGGSAESVLVVDVVANGLNFDDAVHLR